jgi:hypothetical protein
MVFFSSDPTALGEGNLLQHESWRLCKKFPDLFIESHHDEDLFELEKSPGSSSSTALGRPHLQIDLPSIPKHLATPFSVQF